MTTTYTQKYTIVYFFDAPPSTPFSASAWPLHVTIIDTFKTDWPVETLLAAIQQVAANTPAFDITPTKQAMLGPEKDVPVKLIRIDEAIAELHQKLLNLEGSFVFNTPEFVGEGFLPHATDQEDGQVQIGQAYRLSSISLVDMFPEGDHLRRSVIGTFPLHDV